MHMLSPTGLSLPFLSFLIVLFACLSTSLPHAVAKPTAATFPYPNVKRSSNRDAGLLKTLNTNAARLAAGFSPLPVVRRWSATRTDSAKRQLTSQIPITGNLEVRTPNGGLLGYLLINSGNVLLSTTQRGTFMTYINQGTDFTRQINIRNTDSNRYLAGLIDSPAAPLTPASSASALLGTANAPTPVDSPPQEGADPSTADTLAETAIWTVDGGTGRVSARWVNPDGSDVNVFVYYSAANQVFRLTAGPVAFLAAYPEWVPVVFIFS